MLGKGIKKNTGSDGTKISASQLEDFLLSIGIKVYTDNDWS